MTLGSTPRPARSTCGKAPVIRADHPLTQPITVLAAGGDALLNAKHCSAPLSGPWYRWIPDSGSQLAGNHALPGTSHGEIVELEALCCVLVARHFTGGQNPSSPHGGIEGRGAPKYRTKSCSSLTRNHAQGQSLLAARRCVQPSPGD